MHIWCMFVYQCNKVGDGMFKRGNKKKYNSKPVRNQAQYMLAPFKNLNENPLSVVPV